MKSWVHKTLLCLTTTLVALASPVVAELHAVVEHAQDLCRAVLGPNTLQGKKEKVALLEFFARSAHLTKGFARSGYNVLEPRDILVGHNLFDIKKQCLPISTTRNQACCGLPCLAPSGPGGNASTMLAVVKLDDEHVPNRGGSPTLQWSVLGTRLRTARR